MRKIPILAAFLMFGLFSCSSIEKPSEDNSSSQPSLAVIGQVDNGNATMTVAPERLRIAFVEAYALKDADNFQISEVEGNYYLRGFAQVTNDIRRTFAIAMDLGQSGELGITPLSGSQSCTSSTNCSGCDLTINSPTSGSCKCNSQNIPHGPTGRCTHTVSSLTLSDGNKKGSSSEDPLLKVFIQKLNQF